MPLICPPPPTYVDVLNDQGARWCEDRPPIPCTATIEWATGTETIETVATRYDPRDRSVYVLLNDARCRFTGAWIPREQTSL